MRKLPVLALLVVALWTADANAVDIKNIRATYGPFGAPRPAKMLPGDVYLLNFDITNLTIDAKTGATKYVMTLDVTDPKGKQIVPERERVIKKGVVVGLGGNSVPEVVHVILGVDQPPGKYKVTVTVEDPGNKTTKQLVHEVEVMPNDFGIIHVTAPAVGFVGQDYPAGFSLVGWQRDAKKAPKLTITTKVLDEAGKPTVGEPIVSKIPDDLPPGQNWEKQELVQMSAPIFLNRSGKYTVMWEARDELSKKTVKFSYTLTVIDTAGK